MILSDGGEKESLNKEVSVKLTISGTKSYVLVIALAGIPSLLVIFLAISFAVLDTR